MLVLWKTGSFKSCQKKKEQDKPFGGSSLESRNSQGCGRRMNVEFMDLLNKMEAERTNENEISCARMLEIDKDCLLELDM